MLKQKNTRMLIFKVAFSPYKNYTLLHCFGFCVDLFLKRLRFFLFWEASIELRFVRTHFLTVLLHCLFLVEADEEFMKMMFKD